MSETMSSCNESAFIGSKDEYLSETFDGSIDYRKLHLQNENYRQELHELHLKLVHNEAMQRELQEVNESLEQLLIKEKEKAEKKLHEIQEKNRETTEAYENQLSDLGVILENKEKRNKELYDSLHQLKVKASQNNLYKIDDVEEKLTPLKEQVQELLINLEDEKQKKENAEETIKDLKNQLFELQEILEVTKNNLKEKNEVLESTREELVICRSEIETLKIVPANESCKGNSLFAEVEDRRQLAVNKITILKKKYDELKQAYDIKAEEVRTLKTEKASILRKWNECVNIFSEDNELINKYKNRIRDLEKKLLEVQQTNTETKTIDNSFSYLESLLAEKKKEIQELHQKIERDSVDMLLQTEIKHKIAKQLQYWQYKTMYMEAQLSAIKSQLELENADSSDYKLFFEAIEQHRTIYKEFPDKEEIILESDIKNIEKVSSELATLQNTLPINYHKFKNIPQTTDNIDIIYKSDLLINKSRKADIGKNCVDHDNNGQLKFKDKKLEENANVIQRKIIENNTALSLKTTHIETTNLSLIGETQKLQKMIQFAEDTKNSSSDNSMIKKKQNDEKKKITKQYKTIYISSESSK
ncbi:spindle pole body component 110-like [Vespula pensylvanica]|uniref:spindle pole body component 110-like n=1 Tax=Vespula pensylvanica TaxID=30213 RepID=UPI001CB9F022|nr:spindle pole body component 110-like [Vespula pensylvanica]